MTKSKLAIPILATLLVIASFFIGSLWTQTKQLKSGTKTLEGQPAQVANPPAKPTSGQASTDDDPVLGDKNAPITMIEFSDYECPFCKRFYEQALSQIKTNYIDTGKVKLVYRDLPLSFHDPMATKEAIAANCARDQGGDSQYFLYHDEIFNRTKSNGNGLNQNDLQTIAQDLKLNLDQFNSCLQDPNQEQEVKNDLAAATAANATGTPTFIIGPSSSDGNIEGQLVVGAQPYSTFEAIFNTL